MSVSMFVRNFLTFDWIIFVLFGGNLLLFFLVRRAAEELYALLHGSFETARGEERDRTLARMYGLRGRTARLYALYTNVTAIFPLLGILGTVVALLGMTGDLSGMESNFLSALTSTFWGLVASIVFKFLDSFISYKAESNEVYLTNFEETGKRYTVAESYRADRNEAAHEEAEYHH